MSGHTLSEIEMRTRGYTAYESIYHERPKKCVTVAINGSAAFIDLSPYEHKISDIMNAPESIPYDVLKVDLFAYRFEDGYTIYIGINFNKKLLVVNTLNAYWVTK